MAYIEGKDGELAEVIKDNHRVVLYFTAPWCGPCKSFSPIFEELAAGHTDIKFVKLNVDDTPESAKKFNIRSVPTIIGVSGDQQLFQFIGLNQKTTLELALGKFK